MLYTLCFTISPMLSYFSKGEPCQQNMIAAFPMERESLRKPNNDWLPGRYGLTSSVILDTISTFITDCNTHSRGCWGRLFAGAESFLRVKKNGSFTKDDWRGHE